MHQQTPQDTSVQEADLRRISSLIDGELDSNRLLEVIDRIADTEDCRGFYRKARALSGLVAAAEPAAPTPAPASIWSAIAQQTGLEPQRSKRSGGLRQRLSNWLPGDLSNNLGNWNRRPQIATASMAVLLIALAGLTWVGLDRRNLDPNGGPVERLTLASSENDSVENLSVDPEGGVQIQLGSNLDMNDSRFIDLATEILRADQRYRRELLRLMSDIEQSSLSPTEGLGEGYSNRSDGSGSPEDLERDALGGSDSRVRVRMW